MFNESESKYIYNPVEEKFIPMASATKKQLLDSYEWQFDKTKELVDQEFKNVSKIDKRVKTLHGGYMQRASKSLGILNKVCDEMNVAEVECETYRKLLEYEAEKSIPHRIEPLKLRVKNQQEREEILQKEYKMLLDELSAKNNANGNEADMEMLMKEIES